ncbi:9416_t:CDS:2, partial [Gigaspora rosea]
MDNKFQESVERRQQLRIYRTRDAEECPNADAYEMEMDKTIWEENITLDSKKKIEGNL